MKATTPNNCNKRQQSEGAKMHRGGEGEQLSARQHGLLGIGHCQPEEQTCRQCATEDLVSLYPVFYYRDRVSSPTIFRAADHGYLWIADRGLGM